MSELTGSKTFGTLLVVLAGAFWGTMGVFVRYLNSIGLDSMAIVSLRVFLSGGMLAAGAAIFKPSLFRMRWRDVWCFLGTGLVSIVFFTFCYFRTMTRTTLAVSAVLLYTAPIFVMLMSAIFFREKLMLRKLVACAVAFGGCVLVVGLLEGNAAAPADAILTGFGAAVGYALYSIFSRVALQRGYPPLTITLYTFLFACVGVIPLTDFAAVGQAFRSWDAVLMAVGMAVFTTVLPYILYTTGLTRMESSRASIMASVEPVVATLISALFFGEPLSPLGVLGILLVLGAIVLLNLPASLRSKSK